MYIDVLSHKGFTKLVLIGVKKWKDWQLKQIITGGSSKNSQRHELCTHNCTYSLDYVSNNLQLPTIEEGLKSFKREMGEKPPRVVRKRDIARAYKQI